MLTCDNRAIGGLLGNLKSGRGVFGEEMTTKYAKQALNVVEEQVLEVAREIREEEGAKARAEMERALAEMHERHTKQIARLASQEAEAQANRRRKEAEWEAECYETRQAMQRQMESMRERERLARHEAETRRLELLAQAEQVAQAQVVALPPRRHCMDSLAPALGLARTSRVHCPGSSRRPRRPSTSWSKPTACTPPSERRACNPRCPPAHPPSTPTNSGCGTPMQGGRTLLVAPRELLAALRKAMAVAMTATMAATMMAMATVRRRWRSSCQVQQRLKSRGRWNSVLPS